jgi:hypothetical protein
MPKHFIFCNTLLLTVSLSVSGQAPEEDSLLFQTAGKTVIAISSEMANPQSPLYNGSEYVNYDNHIEGHQFFESQVLEEGSVMYDGILYKNVPMLYDIVKDEVIIEHFDRYYKIRLVSERINYFSLLNHTFVRFKKDPESRPELETGFYEILYDGQLTVLLKKAKRYKETIESQRVIRQFLEDDQYYLYKNTSFHPVKGKLSVIQVLKDRKKEVRQFIRQHHLTFKANIGQDLTSISLFYDKLQNE